MAYLILFLLVAGSGIALLWLHQHRQRTNLNSVDGFQESLRRISSHSVSTAIGSSESHRPAQPSTASRRPAPLDPARREAARRRLEARRAIRTH